jgi:hypothetical protein
MALKIILYSIKFLIENVPIDKRIDESFINQLKDMIKQPNFNLIDEGIKTHIEAIDSFLKQGFKQVCSGTPSYYLYNYMFCDNSKLDHHHDTPFNFIKLYVNKMYTDGLRDFTYLCMYYKLKNIPIFDLGDSLHKFVVPFNAFNDNYIKKILLSGNIYDNVYGPNTADGTPSPIIDVKINEDKKKELDSKLDFLEYTLFKDVIELLKQNKKVVIIDYGNSGRALLTLKYIFETINAKYNFNLKNLILIWFSAETKAILGYIKKYVEFPFTVVITDHILFPSEMTNAEEHGYRARCTPKFPIRLWTNEQYKEVLDRNIYDMEITKKETPELFDKLLSIHEKYKYKLDGDTLTIPNYYLCNLHESFSILLSANLIGKIMKICNEHNLETLFDFIKTDIFKNNLLQLDQFKTPEMVDAYIASMQDGGSIYKNKYLKYKQKYLTLKNNLQKL